MCLLELAQVPVGEPPLVVLADQRQPGSWSPLTRTVS
jgi:hypothetical protein